jgi:hypothetical protein
MPLTLTGEALETAKEEQEAVRQRQPFEEWAETIMEFAAEPHHKGMLLNGLGIGDGNEIESPDDDERVLPACATQDMLFDWLGFKRKAMTNIDNAEYGKMKTRLSALGCDLGPKGGRFRVGTVAKQVRGVIFPWATPEDLIRGYCLPVEAEPPTNDDYDDLI